MKIIIQLVGYIENDEDDRYVYQYICNIVSIFNFNIFKILFHKYRNIITDEELDNCSLTCNTKNLKKDYLIDNNTLLDDDVVYKVFIFTSVQVIKDKLIQIFKLDGYKASLNYMLTNHQQKKPPNYYNFDERNSNHFRHSHYNNMSRDYSHKRMFNNHYYDEDDDDTKEYNTLLSINSNEDDLNENNTLLSMNSNEDNTLLSMNLNGDESNEDNISKKMKEIDSEDETEAPPIEDTDPSQIKQHLDLFKDQDFITLLRIFKNREELFNDFYKYINSSQIIKFTKLDNEVDLSNNINFIKELNLNFQEEQIEEALKHTGNHINLAIRCLLHDI